jgi:vanillate O-demethylase ferredoxin subunit
LREIESRGGSRHLHERVRAGDIVEISLPRNNFPLDWTAGRHLLVAGGIGIAPMMAMAAELQRRRAEFKLYYCTRSPGWTAFRKELVSLLAEERLCLHHDGGDSARGLDIAAVVQAAAPGTHLYYCGPAPLMAAVAQAARNWPPGTVHCEYFTAAPPPLLEDDRPFRVRLARSGGEYEVPIGESIVDVLRRHDVAVRTSCEFGYCGACLTPYLAGIPEHRDQMLEENARERYVLICCARSKTPVLELDL